MSYDYQLARISSNSSFTSALSNGKSQNQITLNANLYEHGTADVQKRVANTLEQILCQVNSLRTS